MTKTLTALMAFLAVLAMSMAGVAGCDSGDLPTSSPDAAQTTHVAGAVAPIVFANDLAGSNPQHQYVGAITGVDGGAGTVVVGDGVHATTFLSAVPLVLSASTLTFAVDGGGGAQSLGLGTFGLVMSSATVSTTSGTVTLTAAQYGNPLIVVAASLSNNLNVTFPNSAGFWFVDVSAVTYNAHTLTLQSGSATCVSSSLVSTADLIAVHTSGSNGIACNL